MSASQDTSVQLGASFRDPSGFLFTREGVLFRQVNRVYQEHYDRLMDSGLYQELVAAGLLIPHEEVSVPAPEPELAYKLLRPEPVSFISYPYEWSFSQLQDAALATLEIQKHALAHDLSLKDSSAYNIQFHRGRPVLIDSLSFEIYREGQPWVAYRQFCQHFLAPLSLMAYRDVRLEQLLRVYIDGIPLDLAAELLPSRTRFTPSLAMHLHLHASAQKRYAGKEISSEPAASGRQVSRVAFLGLIDSLQGAVQRLQWSPGGTDWGDYYQETNYTSAGLEHKEQLVREYIDQAAPGNVWDLGANTGRFSRLASRRGIPTVAFDVDPGVVEKNYLECRAGKEQDLLPLLMDLTNPSPSLGWGHRERMSLLARGPAGLVLALALVHHLAIANNVPLAQLADFFHQSGQWLMVEFVPKSDSQVQRLLTSREDIFPGYTEENFERVFTEYFTLHRSEMIQESQRRLYLLERRSR